MVGPGRPGTGTSAPGARSSAAGRRDVRPLRLLLDGFGTYRNKTEIDFTDVEFFALVGTDRVGQEHGHRRALLRSLRHGSALGQRARGAQCSGPVGECVHASAWSSS